MEWTFHRNVLILLPLWAVSSVLFQRWVRSKYLPTVALYCWAGADNVFLAGILWSSQSPSSPLVSCYFLLIAASGFWYRVPLVWFVTATAMASYTGFSVAATQWIREGQKTIDQHAITLICLAVLGFMIGHKVRRVGRLSRYYRHGVR